MVPIRFSITRFYRLGKILTFFVSFQSLLWWMYRWKIISSLFVLVLIRFQSLLWWMYRWKTVIFSNKCTRFVVSILIVVDVPLEASHEDRSWRGKVSFNPYCGGCTAG